MNLIDRMAYYQVPGVSIAMIDENKIEWVRAYGLREKLSKGNGIAILKWEWRFLDKSIRKPGV